MSMKAVLCVLLFSINFASSEWVRIGTKDYSFNTNKKNYLDAKASCISEGGRLFEPRDESTNSVVHDMAIDKGIIALGSGTGFWFGINDMELENHFVYSSSEDEPLTWTNWSSDPFQPDNLEDEDCGEIGRYPNAKWNDYHCYMELTYVCEKDDPFTPSSGDLIFENCDVKAPCTETDPASSGVPNVDVCQALCDLSDQCQSWMFNKDTKHCSKYTCPSKTHLNMCSTTMAPSDVDVTQYKEEIQQGPNFNTTQSCYVFQQSDCTLDSTMVIRTENGEYPTWKECKEICDIYAVEGCTFYEFRFNTCVLYSGNPKVQCRETIGPKNALKYEGDCKNEM